MCTYQGGKKRIGKAIHDAIVQFEQQKYNSKVPYFEPFLGMGSVMAEFGKDQDGRDLSGCDLNEDVIKMWQALQKGWNPPIEVNKEYYIQLKKEMTPSAERGFVGSACSFGGQFFMGYKKTYDRQEKVRNYAKIGWDSIKRVLPYMTNVEILEAQSYDDICPKNMLIYCDPPYKGNKIHTHFFQQFDHNKFWETMREWSKDNIVIVSEHNAPKDFVSIWDKEYRVSFMKKGLNVVKIYVERLFVYKDLV